VRKLAKPPFKAEPTDKICPVCGMIYPDGIEIIHVWNPTLHGGAIHILISRGSKAFMVSYSAPYRPDLHPLFPMHPRKRVQAMLEFTELKREAEMFLRQLAEFRQNFINKNTNSISLVNLRD